MPPVATPWPQGSDSCLTVRMGGLVLAGLTAFVVDTFILPYDAYVRGVDKSYLKTVAFDLDAVSLRTTAGSSQSNKQLVADGDESGAVAGVAQTVHADIVNKKLVQGDKIVLKADSSGTTEGGMLIFTIHLQPATKL